MDTAKTITEMIEYIQQNQCVGCKFGKALISLKDLRDSMEPQGGVSVHKAPRRSQPRKPQARKAAAPAATRGRGRVRDEGEYRDRTGLILDYLRDNPGARSGEIFSATEIPLSTTVRILGELRESGKVRMEGNRRTARYSLAGSGVKTEQNYTKNIHAEDEGEDPKVSECRICGHVSSSKERLTHHIQMVHRATA